MYFDDLLFDGVICITDVFHRRLRDSKTAQCTGTLPSILYNFSSLDFCLLLSLLLLLLLLMVVMFMVGYVRFIKKTAS